jgi:hypothetical protein
MKKISIKIDIETAEEMGRVKLLIDCALQDLAALVASGSNANFANVIVSEAEPQILFARVVNSNNPQLED